jgi:2-keto-4-pentenoate hydratase/2-oxohepta-3-ene-1,7-dioic acid hydratase in catechol pathway
MPASTVDPASLSLHPRIPLAPGDVIVTGTPAGVGARREPPVWLQPGDVVEVDGIGVLRNSVADD